MLLHRKKLLKDLKEWQEMKNLQLLKRSNNTKLEAFQAKLDKTMDIKSKDAEKAINNDPTLSPRRKGEDIAFLEDQLYGNGTSYMGKLDERKAKLDKRKAIRVEDAKQRKIREDLRKSKEVNVKESDERGEDVIDCDDNDEDYVEPSKRRKKSEFIPALIPRNILKLTASTAATQHNSPANHAAMIGSFLIESQVSLEESIVSQSSARRAHIDFYKRGSDKAMDLVNASDFLTLHIDGKQMLDNTDGKVNLSEREAIVMSSPDLLKPQVIEIPSIKSSSAENQTICVMKAINKTKVKEKIIKINSDTTANMTGIRGGTLVKVEKELGRTVLKTPCRKHVAEIIAKHVSETVNGEASTGPEIPMFKLLKKIWTSIVDEIDYDNLDKFDWDNEDERIVEQANETREFLLNASNVFPRDDYNELKNLCLVYLGEKITFNFQKPGASHKARFMASAIYFLKINLLLPQLKSDIFKEKSLEIHRISKFMGVYWIKYFLQCSLYDIAPRNDYNLIVNMIQYENIDPLVAECALDKIKLHFDYLGPHHVVASLVDEGVPKDMREKLAKKLHTIKKPVKFKLGYPKMPDLEHFRSVSKLDLGELVTEESHLIFHLLKVSELDWLNLPIDEWKDHSGFIQFKEYVTTTEVVNDAAERAVKLFQVRKAISSKTSFLS